MSRRRHHLPEPSDKEVVQYLLHATPGVHVCRSLSDVVDPREHHLPLAPRPFRDVAGVVVDRHGLAVQGVVMHDGSCLRVNERWLMPTHHHHLVDGRAEEDEGGDENGYARASLPLRAPLAGGRLAVVTPAGPDDAAHLEQRMARAPSMSREQQTRLLGEIRAARQQDLGKQRQQQQQQEQDQDQEQEQDQPRRLTPDEEAARQDMVRQKALQMRITMGQQYAAEQKQKEEVYRQHLMENMAYDNQRVVDLARAKQEQDDAHERALHPIHPTPDEKIRAAEQERRRMMMDALTRQRAQQAEVAVNSARQQAEITANARAMTNARAESVAKDKNARDKLELIDKAYATRFQAYETARDTAIARKVPLDVSTSHLPSVESSALYNQSLVYVAPHTFVSAIQKREDDTPLARMLTQRQAQTSRPQPLATFDADLLAHDVDRL